MNTSAFFPHITLIGVGLIGGSFMLDLKRLGLVQTVTGIDTNADNLNYALECGIIDHAYPNICAESIGNADLVLIATPVSVLPDVCRDIKPFLKDTACVSDVGSTKQSALNAFRTHLSDRLPQCFATHPIAGSDQSGAKSARCGLFQNSRLIITLHGQEASDCLRRLKSLWQAVGSQISTMSAEEHDNIFAAVSHLPHLAAFAYVHALVDHPHGKDYLPYAATGFRDFTRIASSHPAVWTDICMANRPALLKLTGDLKEQLSKLEQLLSDGNKTGLYRYFEEAAQMRNDWLKNR
jgi:prephenate dehydrogenase